MPLIQDFLTSYLVYSHNWLYLLSDNRHFLGTSSYGWSPFKLTLKKKFLKKWTRAPPTPPVPSSIPKHGRSIHRVTREFSAQGYRLQRSPPPSISNEREDGTDVVVGGGDGRLDYVSESDGRRYSPINYKSPTFPPGKEVKSEKKKYIYM